VFLSYRELVLFNIKTILKKERMYFSKFIKYYFVMESAVKKWNECIQNAIELGVTEHVIIGDYDIGFD
jgi:hypothetical protein